MNVIKRERLHNPENSGVVFDTPRGSKLEASGEIKNGIRETNEGATRFYGWLAFPLPDDPTPAISAVCDLADAVDAGAGFITVEPDYQHAQNAALGSGPLRMRPGLTKQRLQERAARDLHKWERHDRLAGVEWGTFLGAQHIAKLDLNAIRVSSAFERVMEISPTLVFLQVTNDPRDDLSDDFAPKLQRAREVLAPIMIGVSGVS